MLIVKAIWPKVTAKIFKHVLNEKFFGFAYVDIVVPEELYDKFSKIALLLVIQETPDCNITDKMGMRKK